MENKRLNFFQIVHTYQKYVLSDLVHHLIIKNTVQEDYFWNLTIQNLLEYNIIIYDLTSKKKKNLLK